MTNLTQFTPQPTGRDCYVVIGVDFGTSCTKVVIRTPYEAGNPAYAVPFGAAAHTSWEYLLPSVLWVDNSSAFSFTGSRDDGGLLRDIKYHLVQSEPVPLHVDGDEEDGPDSPLVATAYLAQVLQLARRWFLETQETRYGDFKLKWQFNLGLPSADYANTDLCATYKQIATAAWNVSVETPSVTWGAVELALNSVTGADVSAIGDLPIQTIPEVAAEVVGYARSHLRDEGLHLLLDVGASTLDICGFILHESDGDDRYELLTADVRQCGAMVLYKHRVSGVRQAVNDHVGHLWDDCDPVSPIPDDLDKYLPHPQSVSETIIEQDRKYQRDCLRAMWQTVVDLKMNRDPRSPRWRDELPIFLSGGGSAMPFYQKTIDAMANWVHTVYPSCRGLKRLSLVVPDDLIPSVASEHYHRLAVACGLSYPETDIGDVSRPADIPDVPIAPTSDWEGCFVSKDQV